MTNERERVAVYLSKEVRDLAAVYLRRKGLKYQHVLEALFIEWLQKESGEEGAKIKVSKKERTLYDDLLMMNPPAAKDLEPIMRRWIKEAKSAKEIVPANVHEENTSSTEVQSHRTKGRKTA